MWKKKELRQKVLHQLNNLSKEEKMRIERNLRDNLFRNPFWQRSSTIGITISQGAEWDTRQIITQAWKENKNVCVPKCFPETKEMQFYSITSFEQLESVYYQLLEPIPEKTVEIDKNNIELLIVPGVVFDYQGYRIGFGGGYYDRYLKDFNNVTISLCSDIQVVDNLPVEVHDIPVQYLITDKNVMQAKTTST